MFKRLAVNTGVQILGKAVMVVVSLVTTGILTRKLGTTIYGQYILITSLLVFFDTLADFGVSIMGVREASRKKSEEDRIVVWSNVAILRLIMASLSLFLGMIFINVWSDLREIRLEATLAWLMIILTSLAGSLGVVWQTKIRMDIKVAVEVMFPTVFLLCLWWFGREVGLVWVFGTYLLARLVTLGWGWWLGRGTINFRLVDMKLIRELLKMSWPMGVYLLTFTAYDRTVDSLMIRRFLGVNEVAWYGLAYKIYGVLIQPAFFLVSSIFPILSLKKNNIKLFKVSAGILLMASLAIVLGVWLLAPVMIALLAGSEFEASVAVLRLLVVALVFAYLGHLVGFSLISKEGQREMLGVGLIILIFNFVGNLLIIPRFGIVGAAGITVLTEMLSLILMSLRLKRRW